MYLIYFFLSLIAAYLNVFVARNSIHNFVFNKFTSEFSLSLLLVVIKAVIVVASCRKWNGSLIWFSVEFKTKTKKTTINLCICWQIYNSLIYALIEVDRKITGNKIIYCNLQVSLAYTPLGSVLRKYTQYLTKDGKYEQMPKRGHTENCVVHIFSLLEDKRTTYYFTSVIQLQSFQWLTVYDRIISLFLWFHSIFENV